jgi:single-strand DNA-binding protein
MTIIGNLGGDPEMRYTPSGAPVTSFNVAVNDRRKQPDGQMQETTQWFRVSCWNKLADVASQYLKKGASVYVEGPLLVREFTGNDGQKRFSLDLTARELKMLDARGAQVGEDGEVMEPAAAAGASRQPARSSAGSFDAGSSAGDDKILDDIPF